MLLASYRGDQTPNAGNVSKSLRIPVAVEPEGTTFLSVRIFIKGLIGWEENTVDESLLKILPL